MSTSEQSFSAVFAQALRGEPCRVVGLGDDTARLPVGEWTRTADEADHTMLGLCVGATLDIGCGPGRLTAALAELGHVVLGIDVVGEAVEQTRDRGAAALHRDVFGDIPGEGRWRTVLLADGNVGIGGDPVRLLGRARQLLDPRGRMVVELAPPGTPSLTSWVSIEVAGTRSRPFRWSVVGVDAVRPLAAEIGLSVTAVRDHAKRWFAVLEESL